MFATATKAIFRDIADQRKAMNIDYDRQTNNGQNEQEQNKWNTKLINLLAELERYAANTTIINLK